MSYRIVNLKRFLTSIVIVLGILIAISIIFSKHTLSHGGVAYKTITASHGDTLWNIASSEIKINSYYEDKDVRYVIDQIKETNNLKSSSLSVGQELLVYEFTN